MFSSEIKHQIDLELTKAQEARSEGYEGRARVCARRAAGIAIREWQQIRSIEAPVTSAYDLIGWLGNHPGVPAVIQEIAFKLQMRVNESFQISSEVDLISETRGLVDLLEQNLNQFPMKEVVEDSMDNCDNSGIIIYGTRWCGDTIRALRFFDQNHIPYQWIDIDKNLEARTFVEKTNNGCRSVPTIVFPDGSILVEPSLMTLQKKFGMN